MASSRKRLSQERPSIDVLLEEAQQIKPRTACTAIVNRSQRSTCIEQQGHEAVDRASPTPVRGRY